MLTTKRFARAAAPVVLAALIAASCGGDDDAAETTPPTTDAATTVPETDPPETTTPTTVRATTTTTEAPAEPTYPLTGMALEDEAIAARPALVVKIDNHPQARPQSGLNLADIVFEENVENLTRFAAVFHSNESDPVGPIRSGRTQDIDLLGSLNQPLFAWSGGNAKVTTAIRASDLRELSGGSEFYRERSRKAPHNLYSRTADLWALAPDDAGPPPAQFVYRDADADARGAEVQELKLSMDGVRVGWVWDDDEDAFMRFQNDDAHEDAVTETQINTDNVVVLFVEYRPSPADGRSPEAQTLGTGVAWVLTGGVMVEGTWSRADRLDPFTLSDALGNDIELTPGRTFVELSRVDKAAAVGADEDPDDVDFP